MDALCFVVILAVSLAAVVVTVYTVVREVARIVFGEVRERRLRRVRKRWRKGLCLRCGYDLRRSPERCSECGAHRSEQIVR